MKTTTIALAALMTFGSVAQSAQTGPTPEEIREATIRAKEQLKQLVIDIREQDARAAQSNGAPSNANAALGNR